MKNSIRLAVWSGPRNISTAMMRAWENRDDCAVVDEPFYAHYLLETRLDHPGRDEVLRTGELDWRRVIDTLLGPIPAGRSIYYQKHMTHHMLPHIARDFMRQLTHVFLIRDPRVVVASYAKSRPGTVPTMKDIGVEQEAQLFEFVRGIDGGAPLIIDTSDFLKAPETFLRAWCERLDITFSDRMLHWPAGPRETDGVWAPYWYDAVIQSTGFDPWHEREHKVLPEHQALIEACMPHYQALYAQRLQP
jgi:hypothetical protein